MPLPIPHIGAHILPMSWGWDPIPPRFKSRKSPQKPSHSRSKSIIVHGTHIIIEVFQSQLDSTRYTDAQALAFQQSLSLFLRISAHSIDSYGQLTKKFVNRCHVQSQVIWQQTSTVFRELMAIRYCQVPGHGWICSRNSLQEGSQTQSLFVSSKRRISAITMTSLLSWPA